MAPVNMFAQRIRGYRATIIKVKTLFQPRRSVPNSDRPTCEPKRISSEPAQTNSDGVVLFWSNQYPVD